MKKLNVIDWYRVHITVKHSGKMAGMQSLSTSVLLNKTCQARAQDASSVCAKCYAAKQLKRYSALEKCLQHNTEVLTAHLLTDEELPTINAAYFRFEAFGDLNNVVQTINYFAICEHNPATTFALWTKNPVFIKRAIESGYKKPDNLIIVFSVSKLNNDNVQAIELLKKAYPFIDKYFTVFTPEYIETNNININCGGRKCIECLNCYKRNGITMINEKLK